MKAEQFPSGKEGSMGRPQHVEQARFSGDTAALQAMGRKGAEAANANRKQRKIEDEMFETARAEEALARKEQANEHIVPIDSDL